MTTPSCALWRRHLAGPATTLAVLLLGVVACDSVIVRQPEPDARYANPLTIDLELRDRAVQNSFRAEVDGQDITSLFAFSGNPRRASAQIPPLERSPHFLRVYADMSPRQAFDSRGRDIWFWITTPPPTGGGGGVGTSPGIALSLGSNELDVVWGNAAVVSADVQSLNGFSGPVDLALFNPPVGVTSPQTTVNVPSNSTTSTQLSLGTVFAGTELRPGPVQIRATPQTGALARTRSLDLHIDRQAGDFDRVQLITVNDSCGPMDADIPVPNVANVNITGPFGNTQPQSLAFSDGFAFSDDCRAAVLVTPVDPNSGEPNTNLLNLDFPRAIGADPPGRIVANPAGFFVEGWFSADDSLFVLVTPGTGTGQAASATLYDVPTGAPIDRSKHFTATVDRVSLAGHTVTLHTTPPLSQPDWPLR